MAVDLDELFHLSRSFLATKNASYQRDWLQEVLLKKNHRLSILRGPRGVGKTTLIVQWLLVKGDQDLLSKVILYIPADHFLLSNYSLYEIAEQFNLVGGKYLAIDEIHKYNEWSKELKSIYDTFPELTVVVSGSSAMEVHKGSHDLTRRAVVYNINIFSFREYLSLILQYSLPKYSLETILKTHEKIASETVLKILANKDLKIIFEFNQYLQTGNLPYFIEHDQESYYMTLRESMQAVIEYDLPAIYPLLTGSSIRRIKKLLGFIANSVPFTANFKNLKTLVEVGDERTLKNYFKYLEDAGLIKILMRASKNLKKLEILEKIYLSNPNQLYAVSDKPNLGTVRELFFLSMLTVDHEVSCSQEGDFMVNNKYTFEIGGDGKGFLQIKNKAYSYLACDNMELGINNKIPLWLFGFLY